MSGDEEEAVRFAEMYANRSHSFDERQEKYLESNPEARRRRQRMRGGMEEEDLVLDADREVQLMMRMHSRLQADIQ